MAGSVFLPPGGVGGFSMPDLSDYQLRSEKGQPNGYAPLGADGIVPDEHLPPSSGGPVLFPKVGDIRHTYRAEEDGWLTCDARTLSQAAYPDLFAEVGLWEELWLPEITGTDRTLYDVAYDPVTGWHLAVGGNAGTEALLISRDGDIWTPLTSASPGTSWQSVARFNNLWVIGGNSGSSQTSPDGGTWTVRSNPLNGNIHRMVPHPSGTYMLSVNSSADNLVARTGNGTTWTSHNTGANAVDLAWGNGTWVSVGSSGGISTSPDGINWTVQTPAGVTTSFLAIAFGAGRFVAARAANDAWTSTDGVTWTPVTITSPGNNVIRRITYSGGKFLAVGDSTFVATSDDGLTWYQRDTGIDSGNYWGGVRGRDMWFVVGPSGRIYSTPAITAYNPATEFALPYFVESRNRRNPHPANVQIFSGVSP